MKHIFWIASYPKSGNTWIRAILSSLFFTHDGMFNFELFKNISYFETKKNYNFVKSINNIDFNNLKDIRTISKYRLEAQKRVKIIKGDFAFFKTHGANLIVNNYKYTSEETTRGLIYIIRDPRDVVISLTNHYDKTIDEMINFILREKNYYVSEIPHYISSWNHHYKSWLSLKVPKLVIKYENLLNNNEEVLWNIVNFFYKNYKFKFENIEKKINNIIQSTNFKKLQDHEFKFGFREARKGRFFHKGKANQWKEILTTRQLKKVENSFKKTMKELDYIK